MATKLSVSHFSDAGDQPFAAQPCGFGCSGTCYMRNHTEIFSLCSLLHLTWCPQNSFVVKEVSECPSLLRLSNIPLYCRPCFVHLFTCQNFVTFSYLLVVDKTAMPMGSPASSGYVSKRLSWNRRTYGII